MKTKIIFPSGSYLITEKIPITGHFTEHFTFEEVSNPSSGEDIILEIYPDSWKFMAMAEEFRNSRYNRAKLVCHVNSGYRTQKFNDSLPDSVKWSGHTRLCALDIAGSLSNTELRAEVDDWRNLCDKYGTTGEFIVHKNYIHIGAFIEHYTNPYTDEFYYEDRR